MFLHHSLICNVWEFLIRVQLATPVTLLFINWFAKYLQNSKALIIVSLAGMAWMLQLHSLFYRSMVLQVRYVLVFSGCATLSTINCFREWSLCGLNICYEASSFFLLYHKGKFIINAECNHATLSAHRHNFFVCLTSLLFNSLKW